MTKPKRKKKDKEVPPQVEDERDLENGSSNTWEDSVINLSEMCETCELAHFNEDCPPECLVIQARQTEEEDED